MIVATPIEAETAIVLCAIRGDSGRSQLAAFVERAGAIIVPFEAAHWRSAADAWLRYGKGRHPAALNFGDCLAYATAQVTGQPLLCTGGDFAQTELPLA